MNKQSNLVSITKEQLEYYLERSTLISVLQSQIAHYEEELLSKNQQIDSLKKELAGKSINTAIHSRNSSLYNAFGLSFIRLNNSLPQSPRKSILHQTMSNFNENIYINEIQSLKERIDVLKTKITNDTNIFNKKLEEKENEIRKLEMIYEDEGIKSKIKLEEKQSEIQLLHKQIKELEEDSKNNSENNKNNCKLNHNFKESEILYYYEQYLRSKTLRDEIMNLKVENDELKLGSSSRSKRNVKNEKMEEMSKKIKELEYKLSSVKLYNETISHYIKLRDKEMKENEKLKDTLSRIKLKLKSEYDIKLFLTNDNKNIKILKFKNESENSSIVSDDSSDLIGNPKCRINSYDENDT